MKKVLIIAYHFPPDPGVGALRPDGLAKYLPEYGWQPVLLTAKMTDERRKSLHKDLPVFESPSFDVMRFLRKPFSFGVTEDKNRFQTPVLKSGETPKSNFDKLKHFVKCCTAFPDRHNGWWFSARQHAKSIVLDRKIDLVISTSPPFTSALVGASLAKSLGVPWIADCRDLWSQYHRYDFGSIRQMLDRWLEYQTFKHAAALVVVSHLRAAKLQKLHPNAWIEPITLGFDPIHFIDNRVSSCKDVFTVTHVGKLKGQQNARPLFKALAEAIDDALIPRKRIGVHFWGPVEQEQIQFAKDQGLQDCVFFHDLVPRQEVLQKEMESHLLLLFTWNDSDELGIHPGKLFDYLGARRPILAIGDHRDVGADVVIETKTGLHRSSVADIKEYICNSYRTFENTGRFEFMGDESAIGKYSYSEIARQYALLMDSVIDS